MSSTLLDARQMTRHFGVRTVLDALIVAGDRPGRSAISLIDRPSIRSG